ncbi:MAG: protein-export chaperone SecB [Micavibrio aeruginosavorus]|uniref:Protein-export chaperone SecB n=1 Tax=Micavibrio aeruginosavorus TaxID=349221 RepID=A0A7T5R2Q6_9BACT|nr:MAG: protein-export chaperone SecB [Micavibrio aeruginosavorus]
MNDDIAQGMTDTEAVAHTAPAQALPVIFHAQFVRDISFENPQPALLYEVKGLRPAMDVNFSIECAPVKSEQYKFMYEVQLGIKVRARRGDDIAFLTEVLYSVLVSMDGVPEEQHHPLLYIEAPRYAFPFVRMIIANLTQNAGMMPLLLAPVDFRALYMQRFGEEIRKSQQAAQGVA